MATAFFVERRGAFAVFGVVFRARLAFDEVLRLALVPFFVVFLDRVGLMVLAPNVANFQRR